MANITCAPTVAGGYAERGLQGAAATHLSSSEEGDKNPEQEDAVLPQNPEEVRYAVDAGHKSKEVCHHQEGDVDRCAQAGEMSIPRPRPQGLGPGLLDGPLDTLERDEK